MKKLSLLLAIFFQVLIFTPTVQGFSHPEINVVRGNTIELLIPKYDIDRIESAYYENPVLFYEIEAEPKFDEAISRAEFIELMFKNSIPPEIDISNAQSFPDVTEENPYYTSIQLASAAGIINGYENGDFGPYDTITRGQIAKITVNFFNPPTNENIVLKTFPDVQENHVFYKHINHAINSGYYKGYPDGLMRPDRPINFSEAETIISRAANLEKTEVETLGKRKYFRAFIGTQRQAIADDEVINLTVFRDNGESSTETIPLSILWRDYPTHSFSLPPAKTQLFGDDEQDNTWELIYGAMTTPEQTQLWEGNFIVPTLGETTLGYGDKLYINGKYSGSHFGIDYANVTGTPVNASNKGIIKLADFTPSYGGTIVIDHGHNVFTMYLHLSELKVEAGQNVIKGELIGLMGDTGIATGSHLHFTHFIGRVIVDNQQWLDGEF